MISDLYDHHLKKSWTIYGWLRTLQQLLNIWYVFLPSFQCQLLLFPLGIYGSKVKNYLQCQYLRSPFYQPWLHLVLKCINDNLLDKAWNPFLFYFIFKYLEYLTWRNCKMLAGNISLMTGPVTLLQYSVYGIMSYIFSAKGRVYSEWMSFMVYSWFILSFCELTLCHQTGFKGLEVHWKLPSTVCEHCSHGFTAGHHF